MVLANRTEAFAQKITEAVCKTTQHDRFDRSELPATNQDHHAFQMLPVQSGAYDCRANPQTISGKASCAFREGFKGLLRREREREKGDSLGGHK